MKQFRVLSIAGSVANMKETNHGQNLLLMPIFYNLEAFKGQNILKLGQNSTPNLVQSYINYNGRNIGVSGNIKWNFRMKFWQVNLLNHHSRIYSSSLCEFRDFSWDGYIDVGDGFWWQVRDVGDRFLISPSTPTFRKSPQKQYAVTIILKMSPS